MAGDTGSPGNKKEEPFDSSFRGGRDKQKLTSQREKFLGTCPHCKQPLKYVYGTNILSCENPECKGKKVSISKEDGEEKIVYKPYFKLLSDKGLEIGTTIFED